VCVPRAGQGAREGLGVEGERGQSGFECDVPRSTSSPKEEEMDEMECEVLATVNSAVASSSVSTRAPPHPANAAPQCRGSTGSRRERANGSRRLPKALFLARPRDRRDGGGASGGVGGGRQEGDAGAPGEDMGEGAEGRASSVDKKKQDKL
jgi:hypothetical protein